ncbi:hypothetical protein [Brevundimonas sp.]|uniref:hypothetical protein n=1 Tax=Brevundimonas sp. TaxID=1871086 RepID=UPI00262B54A2|nr:hypothetical protein [Brevundimonas sp.]
MTFDDLYKLVASAQQTRTLALDIIDFAPSAAESIRKWIDTTRLQLSRVSVAQLAPAELRLTGSMQLGLRIDCELRFFREPEGIGYALTFATSNPLDLLRGDFKAISDLVAIDALWWTAASRRMAGVDVAITGLEAEALEFRQGFDNLHLRLNSPVLDALTLGGSVFSVTMNGQIPAFSVAKELRFDLDPVLEARFQRLTVGANGDVELEGKVIPKLLGAQIPPIPADMHFDTTSVAIRVPVPNPPSMPRGIPFQAITLSKLFAEVRGSLGAANYGIAADGRYLLPGGSGNGGTFRFEYSAENRSPVPDTIELSINELMIGDVLNLLSPVAVTPPAGIDEAITLSNGYAYYAAKQGARSASGVTLEKGLTARSGITVFGAPGYFSVDVHQSAMAATVLTNPLKLGRVLALRGTGVRPPTQYVGPRFAPDAIGIAIDTGAGTARASLIVDFLGQTIQRMEGAIERGGITLKTRASLNYIADVPLEVHAGVNGLSAKGGFKFQQTVDVPFTSGFNLQGLGNFSGSFAVTGDGTGAAKIAVEASLTIAGFTVSLPRPLEIDPDRLKDLAKLVSLALYEAARVLLRDAVELVKAFLLGAVRYTLSAAEAGRKLVTYLVVECHATAEQLITIMHQAGATAGRALELVRDGAAALGEFAFETVVGTLSKLYAATEVLTTLRQWAEQFAGAAVEKIAENLAWLMRKGGFAAQAIVDEAWRHVRNLPNAAKVFSRVLMLGGVSASEIAKHLKGLSVKIEDVGDILGRIFGTDILEEILKPAFGPGEASRVAGNVQQELGRFSRNVEDEWNDFWGRLGVKW